MKIFNISNHPLDNTITRTANRCLLEANKRGQFIALQIEIKHYQNGVYNPLIQDGIVTLIANTSIWLNAQGEEVPKMIEQIIEVEGEHFLTQVENPEAIINEYDYFETLSETDMGIERVVEQKIRFIDSEAGEWKINKYING